MKNNICTYIVQSKDNNLIKKSSSGGMFAELSKYVLKQDGVVFGCTMERIDKGFDVKHIYIEDEKDLYKLQGSKYVQSNLGNTIKQAKDFLDNGRLVLFSGTPCQIAGLKAYLKQDYEKLITVDLSCTGTPSLAVFNDYIKFLENKYKKKIINFEFRNKEKLGWSCGNVLITFDNGKQKILFNNISSYMNLFINKKLQKESCQKCKYSGVERISDITVADAWGIEHEYPELLKDKFQQNKGISLITLNNEKVCKLFEDINDNLVYEKVSISKFLKYNNPLNKNENNIIESLYLDAYKNNGYSAVEAIFKKNLGNKYIYYLIKNNTPNFIKKIIKLFIPRKIDCLLMTLYFLSNYGSVLTVYALSKTVSNLGYSNRVIHYGNLYGFGKSFVKKYLKLTKRCVTNKDFKRLNKLSNTFVIGSDNLLNLEMLALPDVAKSLFNYTDENKKRIMISGSIGSWDGSTHTQQEHNYVKYLLERFDYVSTREEHGKNVFENIFDIKSDWINDPVFYLEKQDYLELIKDVKQDYSDKIMQYILYPSEKTNEIIEYYQNSLDSDIYKFDGNENVKYLTNNKDKSVGNWLSAIINSKLVISDSFHCISFCLIFNKPFVCIKNTHSTVRFTSLFNKLGVNIPLIESIEDLKQYDLSYDTSKVNDELEKIRVNALEKIQKSLLEDKKQNVHNIEMEKYNKEYLDTNVAWYKRNKLFYLLIIATFVIPFKRIWADIKNEHC